MTGPGQLKDNLKITFSSLEAILDLFLDLFFHLKTILALYSNLQTKGHSINFNHV
jgi:hypothetical protein